eukprot:gnl/Dysnectes_brevis/3791_a4875_1339.p1 GENE.gnl/Dysnectes_brevis/3791_a4875_1339~~gnl/Dysnectes_brevis/3791_a4875_1339.p1  ORF type:complete len:132 (-),score=0.58 gnl/Dysnectes_brevis/3791_a4875_1339:23-418(-)
MCYIIILMMLVYIRCIRYDKASYPCNDNEIYSIDEQGSLLCHDSLHVSHTPKTQYCYLSPRYIIECIDIDNEVNSTDQSSTLLFWVTPSVPCIIISLMFPSLVILYKYRPLYAKTSSKPKKRRRKQSKVRL